MTRGRGGGGARGSKNFHSNPTHSCTHEGPERSENLQNVGSVSSRRATAKGGLYDMKIHLPSDLLRVLRVQQSLEPQAQADVPTVAVTVFIVPKMTR